MWAVRVAGDDCSRSVPIHAWFLRPEYADVAAENGVEVDAVLLFGIVWLGERER